MGLVLYLKKPYVPPPPAPPPPTAPLSAGEITGPGGTLCQGKPVALTDGQRSERTSTYLQLEAQRFRSDHYRT